MFSEDELTKIEKDASKYKKRIKKHLISTVYEDLLDARNCKVVKLGQMRSLVEEATTMVAEAAKRLNLVADD